MYYSTDYSQRTEEKVHWNKRKCVCIRTQRWWISFKFPPPPREHDIDVSENCWKNTTRPNCSRKIHMEALLKRPRVISRVIIVCVIKIIIKRDTVHNEGPNRRVFTDGRSSVRSYRNRIQNPTCRAGLSHS